MLRWLFGVDVFVVVATAVVASVPGTAMKQEDEAAAELYFRSFTSSYDGIDIVVVVDVVIVIACCFATTTDIG
jgi:hypothetical protein